MQRTAAARSAAQTAGNLCGAFGVLSVLVAIGAPVVAFVSGGPQEWVAGAAFFIVGLLSAFQSFMQAWLCGQASMALEMMAHTADAVDDVQRAA